MSTKRIDSLTALAREGLLLRVECKCGRVVLLDPIKLLDRSNRVGGGHLIARAAARLRCGDCGARPVSYGPA